MPEPKKAPKTTTIVPKARQTGISPVTQVSAMEAPALPAVPEPLTPADGPLEVLSQGLADLKALKQENRDLRDALTRVSAERGALGVENTDLQDQLTLARSTVSLTDDDLKRLRDLQCDVEFRRDPRTGEDRVKIAGTRMGSLKAYRGPTLVEALAQMRPK